LPLVERVLQEARRQERAGSLATLFVSAGGIEIGLPLDCVRCVLHQTATRPLPLGPHYLCDVLDLHGEPVLVLDLSRRLGRKHALPLEERKLVVIECESAPLALCVDEVRDPEELGRDQVVPRQEVAGSEHGPLREALVALARTARGPLPIIDPRALVSRRLLAELAQALRAEAAA
jgi:chemotaxis signal transduction protein